MFFSTFFIVAAIVIGLFLVEIFKIVLNPIPKLIVSIFLGLLTSTIFVFITSLFFGLNFATVLICQALLLILPTAFFLKRGEIPQIFENLNLKNNLFPTFTLVFLFIVTGLIFLNSIFISDAGFVAGNRLVWTDWPIHFAIISSFSQGNNFPPQNPSHAPSFLTYPYFSDFFSATLQVLGASWKMSFVLPGIIFGVLSISLFYLFGLAAFGKKNISALAVLIALFWGGVGFIYFFQDLATSGNFLQTLLFPPKEYTFLEDKNLWFFSFLYSELLPQRAFLFGMPMFFITLTLLILGIAKKRNSYLSLAGVVAAIMPFFHMHSFLSTIFFSVPFLTLTLLTSLKNEGITYTRKEATNIFIHFLLPIIGLGFIQLPLFLSVNLSQTIGLNFGWMKQDENFFIFWLKNTGIFIPLVLFALFREKFNLLQRNILISASVLFILPNIFRFAPWAYDNLKIITYWYFLSSFAVSSILISIFKKNFLAKVFVILVVISLTLSGFIEDFRVLNTHKTKIPLFSKNDLDLASDIIRFTQPQSIILTAAIHDHPASVLTGRKIVLGFPGNAWAWGFADWQEREVDVREMLKGGEQTPFLISKYNISYALISERERIFEPALNEDYFSTNGTFVAGGSTYKLYKLK